MNEENEEDQSLRETIQEAGRNLYENIDDPILQNIAGDLMGLNENKVKYLQMKGEETYGMQNILEYGYSENQRKWLKILADKIEEDSWHQKKNIEEMDEYELLELQHYLVYKRDLLRVEQRKIDVKLDEVRDELNDKERGNDG